jgi:hypothetical protein
LPGRGIPSAAADIEHPDPKEFTGENKSSPAAKQACRKLIREDIAAALHLAMANGALALEYLETGDDFAVRFFVHRTRLYADFAAGCAIDLRRVSV